MSPWRKAGPSLYTSIFESLSVPLPVTHVMTRVGTDVVLFATLRDLTASYC
jgi:hypothetical protein